MHEFFEHTADLGIRVRAASLDALFVDAATALFAAIVDEPGSVQPLEEIEIRLENNDPAYLLFDWLNELLFRFDTAHRLFSRFEAHVKGERFIGKAWGEALDRARHVLGHEVKAITYHGLRVERYGEGWLAEFIVDI